MTSPNTARFASMKRMRGDSQATPGRPWLIESVRLPLPAIPVPSAIVSQRGPLIAAQDCHGGFDGQSAGSWRVGCCSVPARTNEEDGDHSRTRLLPPRGDFYPTDESASAQREPLILGPQISLLGSRSLIGQPRECHASAHNQPLAPSSSALT